MCIFAVVKIEQSIQQFAHYISSERRLAEGTVKYYLSGVEDFAGYLHSQGVSDIGQIDARHVRAWQMALMQSGRKASTVVKLLSALRAWFRYLRRQQLMQRDIMAKVSTPRLPDRLPVFFRKQEAETIYADIYPHNFDGERDKLTLRLLYETGMRRSELATLRLSAIDIHALTIKVHGKRDKERIVPISEELALTIARYLAARTEVTAARTADVPSYTPPETLLVNADGTAVNSAKIYRIVQKYMRPRSSAERTSPHVFRHTFATHMLDQGANIDAIKDLLGHASLDSTEIYTHVTRAHLKETYKHAHPRALK